MKFIATVPYYTFESIRALADEVRRTHSRDGLWPVDIEGIIEIGFGIDIVPVSALKTRFGNDGMLAKDGSTIYIDRELYINEKFVKRRRFTLAHELGHYLLHCHVNAIGFSCVGDWIDFVTGIDKRAERDADEFAGRLLVPTEKLISDISEMREEIAGMENAALAVGIDDVPSIYQWKINAISSALAPRYGVAETTIEIRINRERIRI